MDRFTQRTGRQVVDAGTNRLKNLVPRLAGIKDRFLSRMTGKSPNSAPELPKEQAIFLKLQAQLMKGDLWSYARAADFYKLVLELLSEKSQAEKLLDKVRPDAQDSEELKYYQQVVALFEGMTPQEKASNHKSIFTIGAQRQLAQRVGVPLDFVRAVIEHHDVLRADRRWYQILAQHKQALPQTDEDKRRMAWDRLPSETEQEQLEDKQATGAYNEFIVRHRKKKKFYGVPLKGAWFRKSTSGISRWMLRPHKSLPHWIHD